MGDYPSEKKLRKARAEITACRRALGSTTYRDLERIANWLGREPFSRGKEPTWVSTLAPRDLRPISIPRKEMGPGTKRNILDDLSGDADFLESFAIDEGIDGEHDE